ncbi:MAG: exodeoxyribonuclease VII large subunit [Dethiobacteria bacterium]|jgi:exodeoxyribonuclease VII large subunit
MNKIHLNVYTVSQLTRYLKSLFLEDSFLQDIRILGEISNYKLHKPSGHIYFTLKDQESVLRCVFFRSKNRFLLFEPAEGMKVVVRGNVSLYERSGYYQLYVEKLESEGLGTLFLAFEKLKEKLLHEGLFDESNKKQLPRYPRRVGLITSPSGAAIKDFLTTLERRFPCVSVVVYPVAVQGREAPGQIVEALRKLDREWEMDLIVITRGGGSLEELWSFNDEGVARAIYQMKTPVVSAVGHETDFTIADYVADLRASTPTAAAELIAPEKDELLRYIDLQEYHLKVLIKKYLKERSLKLDKFSRAAVFKYPREKINLGYQRVDELLPRLMNSLIYTHELKKTVLKGVSSKLETLSPFNILKRGFVLILDEGNSLVKNVEQLQTGQSIRMIFNDGEVRCQVEKITKGKSFENEKRDPNGGRKKGNDVF